MKKNILTIGIPAFNEELNIGYLLKDLSQQKITLAKLVEIIIISDGSTDNTVQVARQFKQFKNTKLMIVHHKVRKGRAERQNEIMKIAQSDILVLLDADVLLRKSNFIDQLIWPIVTHQAELTSARVREIEEHTFFGKVLQASMDFKRSLFEEVNKGNNLYTCHGRARAFSKILYKQITFKESVGEDAYSYLYAIACGFTYRFVKNAEVFYKLPGTFADHEKQSVRFYNTQKLFEKEFGNDLVNKENYLSTIFLIENLAKALWKNPYLMIYFVMASYLKVKALFSKNLANDWSVSASSKAVRRML